MTFEHLTRDELNECLPHWNSEYIGAFYASCYWLSDFIGTPDVFNDIFAKCTFYWYGKLADGDTVAYVAINTPYKTPSLPLEPTHIEIRLLFENSIPEKSKIQLVQSFADNIGSIVQLHYKNTLNA